MTDLNNLKWFAKYDPAGWRKESRPYVYVDEETGVVVIVRDTPTLTRPPTHEDEPDAFRVMYEPEVSAALYDIVRKCLCAAEPNTTHDVVYEEGEDDD